MIAQVPTNQLVFEENSSGPTGLVVTYNGSTTGITVTPVTPDFWEVQFPGNLLLTKASLPWSEPGSTTLDNVVQFGAGPGGSTFVNSDLTGTGAADELAVLAGTDLVNHGPIMVAFDDDANAAEASVPDTGSTFLLFFLALVALLSATRSRPLRLA